MEKKLEPCIQQALRFLALREHNRHELALKLENKGYEANVIESALDWLTEDGSLDEERYVRAFIQSSNRRHPEGQRLVMHRLLAKGAQREACVAVIGRTYTQEYEDVLVSAAAESIEKKHGRGNEQALRHGLVKAGFSSGAIGRYLSKS